MRQSRGRRRREELPPAAAEFGRRTPAQDHLRSRKQSNASRAASDSVHINGFSAEEDCIAFSIRQSSLKTADEISMKELIEEEVSTMKESRHSSPGLIARLMGLDAFPSLVKQRKLPKKGIDSCSQITSSVDSLRKYGQPEDCSWWSKNVKEEFKDVFEVTEASKGKKHNYHSDTRGMLRFREHENDTGIAKQNFMDTKCFSHDDVPQNPKDFNGALKVTNSTKDLFLELLEDRNSLFAKHLQDLKQEPYSPHRSMITVLKPCKSIKHSRNKVQLSSPKAERNHDKCSHVQQKVTGSFRTHARRFGELYVEGNSGSLSRSSLASSPYPCRHETCVQPSHIVILKPSPGKTQKMAETNFFSNDKLWFGPKKDTVASTIQDFHAEGRNRQNLSNHTEVLKHNLNGSKEIAGEIRRKMRHNLRSPKKRNFIMDMNNCPGSRDSFIMPSIACKLIHPDAISQFPDSFCEWSNSPSSSYSTESFLRSETQSLSSERKNITHHLEDVGLISGASITHKQMHTLSERETPKFTADMLNSKNASGENLASNGVLGCKASHLGLNRKDAQRDGSSRFSPGSKSPPASRSPKLGDGSCYTTMLKDIPDIGPSVSSGTKFSMPMPLLKSSGHQNHKSQLVNSVEEENMLPEREIRVHSDGLRKKIHTEDFTANTELLTAPTDPATADRYQLTNGALFPVLGDEARDLSTQEEQVTQCGFPSPLDNLFIQETLDHGIQVKLLLSESDMARSQSLSSKDLEYSSPVSVLETPPEDEAYSSGCFERLSADLKELRIQLERLKQESAATHLEESEILMLNDTDFAGSDCRLLPLEELRQGFADDDDRDFRYLVDVLLESGIHSIDDSKLVNACYLLGCPPLDQNVFSKLEKRYDTIASWSRSERKLLFDLISCSLEGLVTPCMDVHSRRTPKLGVPTRDRESFVEGLWQMVVKQRKELQCKENKILQAEWFVWEHDVDPVRIEMEKMLSADLLEELVSDFILA